jgi:hypothetical protein
MGAFVGGDPDPANRIFIKHPQSSRNLLQSPSHHRRHHVGNKCSEVVEILWAETRDGMEIKENDIHIWRLLLQLFMHTILNVY